MKSLKETLNALKKKLNRIGNKCKKYGCDFCFSVIGETFREVIDESTKEKHIARFITVEVSGTAKVNDWEFVAELEHTENGNIIRGTGIYEIPERYYTGKPVCEHCKSNRFRKNTYIVRNSTTGEFKQVGKSCLMDFTNGLSAEAVASYIAFFEEVIRGEQVLPGGSFERYVEIVYWVTGVSAGCEVNKSNQNKIYNGEFTIFADYTQNELKKAIKAGEFTLHKVGTDIRVLEDINTMVTTSDTQGDIFKDNQTVRVMDQIANDIAVLFNTKYLGVVPNDAAGRISLWSDIVKHHEQLQEIRAIENFSDSDVTVEQGNTKKSVVVTDLVTVVNAMSKLYMTVTVA